MNLSPPMKQRRFRIWAALILCLAYFALYAYLYLVTPLTESMNDNVVNSLATLAAVIAAIVSLAVWRRYGASTPPRGVWLNFMAAMWGWAIAEVIWVSLYIAGGEELADFSVADAFWSLSYLFFLAALVRQYVLIYRPTNAVRNSYVTLSVLAVLMFTGLYALWLAGANEIPLNLEILVHAFYPMGDFALALGAIFLAWIFRDGVLGRPWLGLIIFTISDLMYTSLEASGLYAWSLAEGNMLTTITDFTYVAAYLAVAFGCYLQWLLLFYGPRLKHDSK